MDKHHRQREARARSAPDAGGDRGLLLAAGAAALAAGVAAWTLRPRRPSADASAGPRHAHRDSPEVVGAVVTIAAPADALYRRWRHFRDFDLFMPEGVEVEPVGAHGDADWTVQGPANAVFQFRSRITADEPGRRIAWAAEGSPARHCGEIRFDETPRGTRVTLEMEFDPPGGAVGMAAARLVGMVNAQDPRRVARQALKRLKQLTETGEIARARPDEPGVGLAGAAA